MSVQPLNDRVPIVNPDGTPSIYFIRMLKERGITIGEKITYEEAVILVEDGIAEWASERDINTTSPILGGGDLSNDLTISHADSGVTPGTYGDATHSPQLTVDAKGHITAVTDVPISGGGGGGSWDFNPPFAADFPTAAGTTAAVMTDDADVGLIVDGGGAGAGLVTRGRLRSITTPTGDWMVTAKIVVTGQGNTQTGFGLCLWHTTDTSKWIQFSQEGRQDIRVQRLGYPSGFNSDIAVFGPLHFVPQFQQIEKVGSTLFFRISGDGKRFITIGSQSATAYFTTPPDLVGLGMYLNDAAFNYHYAVPYWIDAGL